MSINRYPLAGWLAITTAVLLIPLIIFGFYLEVYSVFSIPVNIMLASLKVIILVFSVYILQVFRLLLHESFKFQKADPVITLLIIINIIYTIVSLTGHILPDIKLALGLANTALWIPFGLFYIVLAYQLFRIQETGPGILKFYAFTILISGLCLCSVILIPVGLFAVSASHIMLGIIFLRSTDQVEFV
ncbi:hypothetical protein ACFL6G_05585 [candidate division KSB1 bacterium]